MEFNVPLNGVNRADIWKPEHAQLLIRGGVAYSAVNQDYYTYSVAFDCSAVPRSYRPIASAVNLTVPSHPNPLSYVPV